MKILNSDEKMAITDEEQQEFNNATKCYICNGGFGEESMRGDKVRDHCHIIVSIEDALIMFVTLTTTTRTLKYLCSFII